MITEALVIADECQAISELKMTPPEVIQEIESLWTKVYEAGFKDGVTKRISIN